MESRHFDPRSTIQPSTAGTVGSGLWAGICLVLLVAWSGCSNSSGPPAPAPPNYTLTIQTDPEVVSGIPVQSASYQAGREIQYAFWLQSGETGKLAVTFNGNPVPAQGTFQLTQDVALVATFTPPALASRYPVEQVVLVPATTAPGYGNSTGTWFPEAAWNLKVNGQQPVDVPIGVLYLETEPPADGSLPPASAFTQDNILNPPYTGTFTLTHDGGVNVLGFYDLSAGTVIEYAQGKILYDTQAPTGWRITGTDAGAGIFGWVFGVSETLPEPFYIDLSIDQPNPTLFSPANLAIQATLTNPGHDNKAIPIPVGPENINVIPPNPPNQPNAICRLGINHETLFPFPAVEVDNHRSYTLTWSVNISFTINGTTTCGKPIQVTIPGTTFTVTQEYLYSNPL